MFTNLIHIMPWGSELPPLARAFRTISYSIVCYLALYLGLRFMSADIIRKLPPISNALMFMHHYLWAVALFDLVGYIIVFVWYFGLAELPLIGRFFPKKPQQQQQGGGFDNNNNPYPNFSQEQHEFVDDNYYEDYYEQSEGQEPNAQPSVNAKGKAPTSKIVNVKNSPQSDEQDYHRLSNDDRDSYEEPIIEENINDDNEHSQQLIYINNDYSGNQYEDNEYDEYNNEYNVYNNEYNNEYNDNDQNDNYVDQTYDNTNNAVIDTNAQNYEDNDIDNGDADDPDEYDADADGDGDQYEDGEDDYNQDDDDDEETNE